MQERFDTAMGLLAEAAESLERCAHHNGTADAAESEELVLAERIRAYLATCRPTTPAGMPRLTSPENRLSSESILARAQSEHHHVRIVP
jgi:hypothetical protein